MDRVWVRVSPEGRAGLKLSLLTLHSGKGGLGVFYNRLRPSRVDYVDIVHRSVPPKSPNEWEMCPRARFTGGTSPRSTIPCSRDG